MPIKQDISAKTKLGTIDSSVDVAPGQYDKVSSEVKALTDAAEVNAVSLGQKYDELLGSAGKLGQEMVSGKIPDDVAYAVKQAAGERALSRGLGSKSQAATFMTARDLGTTSLEIATKGAALNSQVAQIYEQRRQYEKTYALDMKRYLEGVRQVDLAQQELGEKSRQFNVTSVISLNQLLAQTLSGYHDTAYRYAATPSANSKGLKSLTADFGGLLAQLRAL